MNIAITTRGYKAPDRLKKHLREKISKLERFEDQILGVDAVLSYEKLDQVVEFKLKLTNKFIIVKEKSDDIFKSIDLAIDNVERQVVKIKSKHRKHDNQKMVEKLAIQS